MRRKVFCLTAMVGASSESTQLGVPWTTFQMAFLGCNRDTWATGRAIFCVLRLFTYRRRVRCFRTESGRLTAGRPRAKAKTKARREARERARARIPWHSPNGLQPRTVGIGKKSPADPKKCPLAQAHSRSSYNVPNVSAKAIHHSSLIWL